jgi:two-component system phosphate regulon response regulator PhoB
MALCATAWSRFLHSCKLYLGTLMSGSVTALARNPAPSTVLVIIESLPVRSLLASHLKQAGLLPIVATSTQEGRWLAGQVRPDAVLIDADATATGQWLAAAHEKRVDDVALTVILSSRPTAAVPSEASNAASSQLWISKPFTPRDLVQRLEVQLSRRRSATPASAPMEATLRLGPLELDPLRHEVRIARGNTIDMVSLPRGELALLRCLMEHEGGVVSREQLITAIWGPGHAAVDVRTVDQNVKRLRKHLGNHCGQPMIQTQRSYGYRLSFGPVMSRP